MSWSARRWAWDYGTKNEKPERHRPGLRPASKLVLAVLASLEDVGRGYAYPSLAALVETTGLSRRGVILQLAELERLGLITVHRTRLASGVNAQNLYRLNVPEHYRSLDQNWNGAAGDHEWNTDEGRVWNRATERWELIGTAEEVVPW